MQCLIHTDTAYIHTDELDLRIMFISPEASWHFFGNVGVFLFLRGADMGQKFEKVAFVGQFLTRTKTDENSQKPA